MDIAKKFSCKVYQQPDVFTFCLGFLLAIGIFVSYVPQHIKVIKRRSSEGLSPAFLLLGSLSAFSALVNIFIVTVPARRCCVTQLSSYQCANSLVGFVQILLQAVGYILIFVLCVFATKHSIRESKSNHHNLTLNFYIFVASALLDILFVIYLFHIDEKGGLDSLLFFADISGVISTVLAIIQYIPQIYTTFTVKHAGSLSIPMMCLQTPGGYVWSYSLYSQPNSQWSSWLPYFAAANLQLVLLLMCVYYKLYFPTKLTEANAELRIAEENMSHSASHTDENTSLL